MQVERFKASKQQEAYAKGSEKGNSYRVSEAMLGTFSGHFWDVLGAKLGGVSAFRVVSISRAVARCKVARLKASKRQESCAKGNEKISFFNEKDRFFLGFTRQNKRFFLGIQKRRLGGFCG